MLKFEIDIESANAEFATAQESFDALARILKKISDYSARMAESEAVASTDADPLAWTDSIKDVNGNRIGFFSFLWEGDEG